MFPLTIWVMKGVIDKNSYERYSAKANIKISMAKWLDVTVDLNASHGVGKGIGGLEMSGYNLVDSL